MCINGFPRGYRNEATCLFRAQRHLMQLTEPPRTKTSYVGLSVSNYKRSLSTGSWQGAQMITATVLKTWTPSLRCHPRQVLHATPTLQGLSTSIRQLTLNQDLFQDRKSV